MPCVDEGDEKGHVIPPTEGCVVPERNITERPLLTYMRFLHNRESSVII